MTPSLSRSPILGIDVGATKIAAGMVNPCTGEICFLTRIPTRRHVAPGEIVSDITAIVAQVMDAARRDPHGPDDMPRAAGIAVPELVDITGQIRSAWNFPLPDLTRTIHEHTGLSVRLESDVRAAAFAEARFGSGQSCDSFAYFSLGSGISYTLCLNGRPGAHMVLPSISPAPALRSPRKTAPVSASPSPRILHPGWGWSVCGPRGAAKN